MYKKNEQSADYYWSLDKLQRFTAVNRKTTELLGCNSEQELLGQKLFDILPETELNAVFADAYHRAIEQHESSSFEFYSNRFNRWYDMQVYASESGVSMYFSDCTARKEAELLQIDSGDKLRLALLALGDCPWEHDFVKNESIICNGIIQALGFDIHEIENVQAFWYAQIHPQDKWIVELNDKGYRDGKRFQHQLEYRMLHKNGTCKWISDRGIVIDRSADGKPLKAIGIHQDITERKNIAEQLRESEMRWHFALDGSNLGLWDWNLLSNEVYFSLRWKQMLGFEEQEVSSHLDEWSKRVHPDDLDGAIADVQRHLRGETAFYENTHRVLCKNGDYKWILDRGLLVKRSEDGLPERMIGTHTDITDLKETERNLQKEKLLTDSMLDSMPGIFYLFDQSGKFLRLNKMYEAVTGYTIEEIATMSPGDFFEEGDKMRILEYIQLVFEKGSMTTEASFLTKSGRKIPMFFKSVRINYDGQSCIVGSAIDISDIKQAEQKIRLLNVQLRNLAKHMETVREEERSFIAREMHEGLGQQLAVLKMNLSWLQNNVDAAKNIREEKLQEMMTLTEDAVGVITKMSMDILPSIIDDLGVVEALRWYSDEFKKLYSNLTVNFETNMETAEMPLMEATALYRIYQECLKNVATHAEASIIDSSFERQNGSFILSVNDNGKGFDVADIESRKTIGIVGMRERSVMIGAEFAIDSEPGKGTSVRVAIPRQQKN